MSGSEHSGPATALVRISVFRAGATSRGATSARGSVIVPFVVQAPVAIATERTTPAAIVICPTATIGIAAAATPLTIIIGASVVSTRSAKRSLGIPWIVWVRSILRILHRMHVDEFELFLPKVMLSGATVQWNTHVIPPVPKLSKIGLWDQVFLC